MSTPGGCAIGTRPVNLHLKGLAAMGATIEQVHGYVEAKADKLRGAKIYLDLPSVGATENIMMAATLAEGTTVIENAAKEPEIEDLATVLNQMGGKVSGAGSDIVQIEGVTSLRGVTHRVIPDRIEAASFVIAGVLTDGDVVVTGARPAHLEAFFIKLKEAGVDLVTDENSVRVRGNGAIKSVDFTTLPYPGFPTDLQAQMMVLMSVADGVSVITETIFENRFHARPGVGSHGCGYSARRKPGGDPRGERAVRGAGDGDGSAGERLADSRRAGGQRYDGSVESLSPGSGLRAY